jgi:tetratricopeptide (TPR) repeat protein
MTVVRLPSRRPKLRPVHDSVHRLNLHAIERGKLRHTAVAIVEAKRAVAIEPTSKELWANLATFFWNARQYDEAMACCDRALSLDQHFNIAYFNKALICESLNRCDEAEGWFAKALIEQSTAEQPDEHNIRRCRGMMRLGLGQYAEGFADYESRIPYTRAIGKNTYPHFPAPYWDGEVPLHGKRVFACIEQGIGDTILFSRFLPWLRRQIGDGKLYLCADHQIMILLWEFVKQGIVEWVPEGVDVPECDYSVVLGSLPHFSGMTLDTLPADPGHIRQRVGTQMRIGKAEVPVPNDPNVFKVGICWTGNSLQERNDERTIPLELMLSLADHPHVWLYSLQAQGTTDLDRLGAHDIVYDLGPQLKARGLTVAATALLQMDLVITSCTMIAHLCGALGIKAWVVLCEYPYWVWGRKESRAPWYPSLKLYRQLRTDDWKEVMGRVRDDLIDRVDGLKSSSPVQTETSNG